jgi:hypothetical protein
VHTINQPTPTIPPVDSTSTTITVLTTPPPRIFIISCSYSSSSSHHSHFVQQHHPTSRHLSFSHPSFSHLLLHHPPSVNNPFIPTPTCQLVPFVLVATSRLRAVDQLVSLFISPHSLLRFRSYPSTHLPIGHYAESTHFDANGKNTTIPTLYKSDTDARLDF